MASRAEAIESTPTQTFLIASNGGSPRPLRLTDPSDPAQISGAVEQELRGP